MRQTDTKLEFLSDQAMTKRLLAAVENIELTSDQTKPHASGFR